MDNSGKIRPEMQGPPVKDFITVSDVSKAIVSTPLSWINVAEAKFSYPKEKDKVKLENLKLKRQPAPDWWPEYDIEYYFFQTGNSNLYKT